ncbi:MAG: glycosyltransferase [Patescibacteria group bacterium]
MKASLLEIAIIIPTYNARGSIIALVKSIKQDAPHALVFVVDDNSPDGTGMLVKQHFAKDKKVTVLIRKGKGGRGSAVIVGFKEALKNKDIQYFIEMDADLCHPPKYIPKMIAKCTDADMVIVSKYLPQSTIAGLTLKRRLMSKLMNFGAKTILQVPITDYSNGYRCYTRPVVAYLVSQKLQAKGFVLLSEIVYRVYKKGFTIAEIPFDFKQQVIGNSNMNMQEVKEAIRTLLLLRFERQ